MIVTLHSTGDRLLFMCASSCSSKTYVWLYGFFLCFKLEMSQSTQRWKCTSPTANAASEQLQSEWQAHTSQIRK